jgi:hypothetical protein
VPERLVSRPLRVRLRTKEAHDAARGALLLYQLRPLLLGDELEVEQPEQAVS